MTKIWSESVLQQYIDDLVEESLTLEYKSSKSLGFEDTKKKEITKDVSSMANSAGGIIIYGLKEFDQQEKRHLPEKLDPINSAKYSKEWIENVIDNIKPKIEGLIIHPIRIGKNSDLVVYVIEIPQSNTAHQAKDFRYYKRHNFKSVPMEDYEIKDVINRLKVADAEILFSYKLIEAQQNSHDYNLIIKILNKGVRLIHNYKIEFTLPLLLQIFPSLEYSYTRDTRSQAYIITYKSIDVLFPKEELDLSQDSILKYRITEDSYLKLEDAEMNKNPYFLNWTIFADEMIPKSGKILISQLNEY